MIGALIIIGLLFAAVKFCSVTTEERHEAGVILPYEYQKAGGLPEWARKSK